MSLRADLQALRRHLDDLAARMDEGLLARYRVRWPPPPGLYWKMRWLAGQAIRALEALRIERRPPWPPGLKHGRARADAKPLLIWAVGSERGTLREACRGFSELEHSLPRFAPVLVTDVADFAYFSRLGWLVEYVPRLSGEGEPYDTRKASFLAWLYRGAPALPITAGLARGPETEEIRRWVEDR